MLRYLCIPEKIGIGAGKDGKLVGITHQAVSNTSTYEDFTEGIVNVSQFLYECPNVNTSYKILPLDINTPTWMRGPGPATGCYGLESALDELSYKLNIDPIELRHEVAGGALRLAHEQVEAAMRIRRQRRLAVDRIIERGRIIAEAAIVRRDRRNEVIERDFGLLGDPLEEAAERGAIVLAAHYLVDEAALIASEFRGVRHHVMRLGL